MTTSGIIQVIMASAGILNCLITAVFLFLKRTGNSKANKLLALILIAIGLKLNYALIINIPHSWGIISNILFVGSETGYLSLGPLFLLYTRMFLNKKTSIPAILSMFLPLTIPAVVDFFFNLVIPLWTLQSFYFLFLIFVFAELRKSVIKKDKKTVFSNHKSWLMTLFLSFAFIWCSINLMLFDYDFYFFELSLIFTLVFYINIYLVIRQYWLQQGESFEPAKYKNSFLSPNAENEISLKLQHVMKQEKLYLDPEITLPKVAGKIGIGPHKVSQVINSKMNMTFNEFINFNRVNEIKNAIVLPEYQNIKISNLAADYGFNSISAFNIAFKKFTNLTPSEFRNLQKASN